MIEPKAKLTYFSGLDLGQMRDFTALAVLEKSTPIVGEGQPRLPSSYSVRHLERFKLGTSYLNIATRIVSIFEDKKLTNSILAIDRTGVGRPVVEIIRKAKPKARLRPITITAGHTVSEDQENGGGLNVPKKDLVGAAQVLLQSRRILIANTLTDAETLRKELQNFQMKITAAANEVFNAREGQHDDLVLAVAMAAWIAENTAVDIPMGGGGASIYTPINNWSFR